MISAEVWVDIQSLGRQGLSIRQIARRLDISRNTVRRHLRGELAAPVYRKAPRPSMLDPYKRYLVERLEQIPELPATVLYREIRARGYPGEITIVKDFFRPLRAERRRLDELTVRFETPPGEQQAQVDWSEFGRLPDGRKLYALGVVLSWSRTQFVHFAPRMTLQELLYGLVLSFDYFGGLPRRLLFDNPRTVVLERKTPARDSKLHPRFADLGHFGLQLQLCRVRRPQTKGKTERPMPYIHGSLVLPCRERWVTPADANRGARHWLDTVANIRIHGTTRERPFDRLPGEGLVPLGDLRPYELSWIEPRRVHKDCHFSWEGNRYSVPWRHGSWAVLVRRFPDGRLEVERDGVVIAWHRERQGKGKTVTLPDHVAGLWERTMGSRVPAASPLSFPPLPSLPPGTEVERRDLAALPAVPGGDLMSAPGAPGSPPHRPGSGSGISSGP